MIENDKDGTDMDKSEETVCCGSLKDSGSPDTRHKHRETDEFGDLIRRLNRIEGQVRGIKKMVEEDRYCVDILTQVSAIQSALNSFNKVLLTNHIKTCVIGDIRQGDDKAVDELCETLKKLMK